MRACVHAGAAVLKPLVDMIGTGAVLCLCSAVAFMGLIWTWLFIPNYTIDSLEQQDQKEKDAASVGPEHDALTRDSADGGSSDSEPIALDRTVSNDIRRY